MADEMLYVGFCRICGTGPLGLRFCGQCGGIVILCDECDAVWTSADLNSKPHFANDLTLACPMCDASLVDPPARWATQDDVHNAAWLDKALKGGELELKLGQAFTPRENETDSHRAAPDAEDDDFIIA